jgi:hypothetical protein
MCGHAPYSGLSERYKESVNKDCHRVKLISHLHLMQEVEKSSMKFVPLYSSVVIKTLPKIKKVTGLLEHYFFFSNATTCPLWTSWSPLQVVTAV